MSCENMETAAERRYPASDPELQQNLEANAAPPNEPNPMAADLQKGATGDVIEKREEISKTDDVIAETSNDGEKELGLHRCLGFHDIAQIIAGKSDETVD